jgi:hypothetical protein
MTWPGLSNLELVSNLLDFDTYQSDMPKCTVVEWQDVEGREFDVHSFAPRTPRQLEEHRESLFWGKSSAPLPDPDWATALQPHLESALSDLTDEFDPEIACEVYLVLQHLPVTPLHQRWIAALEQLASQASPGVGLADRVRQLQGA